METKNRKKLCCVKSYQVPGIIYSRLISKLIIPNDANDWSIWEQNISIYIEIIKRDTQHSCKLLTSTWLERFINKSKNLLFVIQEKASFGKLFKSIKFFHCNCFVYIHPESFHTFV